MKRSISCREKFGPTQHITIYFDDVSDIDYYMSLFVNVASYKFPKHIDKYAIEYITNRVRGTQCKAYTTPDTTLHTTQHTTAYTTPDTTAYTTPDTTLHTTQHPTAYTTFDNTQLRNYVLAKYNSAPNAPAKKPTVKGKNAMVNFIKNIMCGDISDSEAGSIVDWMLTGVV
jgi:hypothetical protein